MWHPTTMKSDMTRVLVESTIRRTLKAMQESPEREARNLVDAGAQFSTGRFQTRLISHAQRMLQNSKSAYYALVKDVVTYADHDNIATFGVNLGYNSCTKGARLIRETEREKGFNIPWALHLRVSQEKLAGDPGLYPSILREGTSLGIYTYLLFVPGEAQAVLPLVMEYPDCAFLLFLEGGQITPAFLEELAPLKNVMVSVRRGEAMEQACRALRTAGRLYAVHGSYSEEEAGYVRSGKWLESVLPARPVFVFLRADLSCTDRTQAEVYQYVTAVRDGQHYPLILMDVARDSLLIDQVISEGECLVGFDQDGSLRTHQGFRREEQGNIFHHPLEEILRLYTPKPAAKKEAVTQSVTAL